jgi:THO complex subunit 2
MLNIISSILLPALASTEGNTFLAGQVWSIIVPLPFGIRFKLYDIWRGPGIGKDGLNNTSSSKSVEVAYAETKALHACKGYMKRLSKETVRMIGRQIARISHSNPLAVFNHILTQIEVFDNLIPLVVEALRYATEMSRDALAGLCLTQLQKEGLKLKPGDTHYTLWFSALARFVGMVYARFPETELRGLLYFLLGRLQAGQSLDLLVLRELLSRMGKCETLLDVSFMNHNNDNYYYLFCMS